jgi:site-specific DNA recombinase
MCFITDSFVHLGGGVCIMYIALYARQSILKEDSISVESQIEYCKHEAHGELYKEYVDRGYSGKNTNRPAFEEMLQEIEAGQILRVIVYKLDRISRSILDFANMMDKFQKYNVEFVSSTEKFDTSTPIGRAMLNICIVFAQLERETIQKRVTDAYYSRSKRGFFMGGRIPYGFALEKTIINGVHTSKYIPISKESEQVRLIYAMYGEADNSLGDIVRYLNQNHIENLRGSTWNTARISEMLRNPVYVKADAQVYEFFKAQRVNIINPVTDFIGMNACYLYKGQSSNTGKTGNLDGKEIVLAPHEGIVASGDWLKCRLRCLNNRQSAKTCKAKNSWLLGKVKCGSCGYALSIAKSKARLGRYFVCSSKLSTKRCKGIGKTVYADLLEEYMLEAIKEKLSGFSKLAGREKEFSDNTEINEQRIGILQINHEIEELLIRVSSANDVLMQYINERIAKLDEEKKKLEDNIKKLMDIPGENRMKTLESPVEKWEGLPSSDKQSVVDVLIKIIYISNDKIEIIWNI